MKNTELRSGNFVKWADCSENLSVGQVTEITASGIWSGNWPVKEPIPLTEEWLVKFGFEEDGEQDYRFYLLDESIAYDIDDKCIRISGSWEWAKIHHVHQLQNLYFALTGVELEIKES